MLRNNNLFIFNFKQYEKIYFCGNKIFFTYNSCGRCVFNLCRIYIVFLSFNIPIKAINFKKSKENIDILILGSSHNQNAINPEIINDFSCSNLACGGQDVRIDSALFNLVFEQLPKLQFVVFELSYHTLEYENKIMYSGNSLYLRFYNINLFNRGVNIKDYSIYLSNPKFYNRFLNPFAKKISVNKYGFATDLFSDGSELHRFKKLKYNENVILNDTANKYIKRHKYEDVEAYNKNTLTISRMINECIKKDITPIIISPPVYKSYFNSYINSKEKRRKDFINKILLNYPYSVYIDYEQDNRFKVTDFKNEDHLNPIGAKKFSRLLNDTINEIKALSQAIKR